MAVDALGCARMRSLVAQVCDVVPPLPAVFKSWSRAFDQNAPKQRAEISN